MEKLTKQEQKNKPRKKRKIFKNYKRAIIVAVFIIYMIIFSYKAVEDSKLKGGEILLNDFYEMIENDEVDSIAINYTERTITIFDKSGRTFITVNPDNDYFIHELMDKGVKVQTQLTTTEDAIMNIATYVPIIVIMSMFAIYLSSTIVGANTKMFTMLKNDMNFTTFDDVKGMTKTKQQVQFIISQLRNWKQLGKLGARPCKGVLLFGPPGVGKTLLAKAIAKESGVGFISASGSDFNEVFVGVGAGRVRSLFELAAVNAPCVVFIDEIDCLGKRRKGGDGASQDHNQTLNALLQKMDGLNDANGVIVIGATNRKDDLDDALMRPGRFDRHFYIGAPDNKSDRDEIVKLYLENKRVDKDVTLDKVSKLMVGLTGAEIEESLNSAVYLSLQDGRDGIIKLSDIDEAMMQLSSDGVSKEHTSKFDEEISAVHESGHALVDLLNGKNIAKISNIPYTSGMGGVTLRDMDVDEDKKFKLKSDYIKDIQMLLAGECAETVIYGEHSQGCSNDIEKATKLVYNMITAYALDDNIFNENTLIENGVKKEVSSDVVKKCNDLLKQYEAETLKMLKDNKRRLEKLSKYLIEQKTVVQPTIEMIDGLK